MPATIGTLGRLWRYPVKSMLGERCRTLMLETRGVRGDRRFAVRDASGKLGSGKHTRRFRKIDGLFRLAARYRGGVVEIRFPDGTIVDSDDAAIDDALSAVLGRPVVLAAEADVEHLDAGPVHLLTSASLAWLGAALPDAGVDERRFRPNLVIELPGQGLVERDWVGAELAIGDARLRVCADTERCGMIAFAQSELRADPRILRQVTERAGLRFGVYAEVIVAGEIRLNDTVQRVA